MMHVVLIMLMFLLGTISCKIHILHTLCISCVLFCTIWALQLAVQVVAVTRGAHPDVGIECLQYCVIQSGVHGWLAITCVLCS